MLIKTFQPLFSGIVAFAAVAGLVIGSIALYRVTTVPTASASVERQVLQEILTKIDEHQHLLDELKSPKFSENGKGVLESYLLKIRRDGVPSHSDMQRKIEALDRNTVALSTLLELYAPSAKTAEFKAESKSFFSYATSWFERWNAMFTYFMAGGDYPPASSSFPSGLYSAIKAEESVL